jgi:hypothetical protein
MGQGTAVPKHIPFLPALVCTLEHDKRRQRREEQGTCEQVVLYKCLEMEDIWDLCAVIEDELDGLKRSGGSGGSRRTYKHGEEGKKWRVKMRLAGRCQRVGWR